MATAASKPAQRARAARTSAAAWKQKALHDITLPTGVQVTIRIPDVGMLLKGGAVPEKLRIAALAYISRELTGKVPGLVREEDDGNAIIDEEILADQMRMHDWIVLQSVVEPQLTEDDLPNIPVEDLVMLTEIANRERDTDALGVRLGVEPLDRWLPFREAHGCPAEGCPACEAARARLSTRNVGPL